MSYYNNVDIFSALSDPTRRQIIEMLASHGPLSATEIYEQFPVSYAAISQHLKALREAGFVRVEKRAQRRIYHINLQAMLELEDWARQQTELWNRRFDALERLLEVEKMKTKTDVSKNLSQQTGRELTLTRDFDAPRELVFKAWTDCALLAHWWGPRYFTNPVCEVDPRPGGRIFIVMHGPDEVDYPMEGKFQEVIPPERLVFTATAIEDAEGNPQLKNRTTVTFEDVNGKTRLTVHVVITMATVAAEGALSGMDIGWNQSLDKLAEFLGHF